MSSGTLDENPTVPVPTAVPDASYGRIVRVSVPMVLSTAVAMVAQVVVLGLVGHIGGAALYVRSVYTPVAYLFLAVTTGLGVTLTVLVAQAHGRGERTGLGGYLGSVARAGAVVFGLLAVLLTVLFRPLADAVQIAPDRRALFHGFLLAMTAAALLGLLGELCSALLRGLGRTGTAAAITGAYVGLNVGIVVVGGLVLDGGLMAVPVAGAVAGLAEIVLGLAVLARAGAVSLRGLAGWRPEVPRMLLAIGLPVGASLIVLSVVNLLLLRIVAPAGQLAVAGFTVGYTLQSAIIVPAVGLGSAIAVLVNQALPAGGPPAARRVLHRGLVLATAGYGVITVGLVLFGAPLATLLAGDPAVAPEAREFVTLVGPTFGATGLTLAVLTVLEQVGHGLLAVVLNGLYFVAILAVGWWLVAHRGGDVVELYRTMAIAAVAGLVTGMPIALRAARRPRVLGR